MSPHLNLEHSECVMQYCWKLKCISGDHETIAFWDWSVYEHLNQINTHNPMWQYGDNNTPYSRFNHQAVNTVHGECQCEAVQCLLLKDGEWEMKCKTKCKILQFPHLWQEKNHFWCVYFYYLICVLCIVNYLFCKLCSPACQTRWIALIH